MHELSIAMSIVDICLDNIKSEKFGKVTTVELEIGELSGVVIEALETAMDQSVRGTVMEGADISINKVTGEGKCRSCGKVQPMHEHYTQCNECGSFEMDIIKGDELKVKSIILD